MCNNSGVLQDMVTTARVVRMVRVTMGGWMCLGWWVVVVSGGGWWWWWVVVSAAYKTGLEKPLVARTVGMRGPGGPSARAVLCGDRRVCTCVSSKNWAKQNKL